MVDILEQSGANKPKAPLANLPTSTQSEAQLAAPGVEMGRALRGSGSAFDALSEKLDASSIPEAQAAGISAVGRDEKGNPTFEPRMFALSGADRAYNAAGRSGALAAWHSNMQSGLQELAQKHNADPAGFQTAAKAYVRNTISGAGSDIKPLALAEGDKLAQQFMLSISNRKFTLDTENAKIAISTQIEDNQNSLFAMARKGGSETPEAIEAMARVRGLYEELGKNPAYGYPAARVESEIERVRSQARSEAIVGDVDRTYTKSGKAAAQRFLTDSILNNEKLNLSTSQRAQFYNAGLARLQFLDGETKAQVDAHRSTVNTIVTGLQSRVQIPDAQIDDAIGKAQKLGDAESVLKLSAARAIATLRRDTGLTDEQEVKLFAGLGGLPGTVPASAPADVATVIGNAANKYGLSPRFLAKVAHIETGGTFDPNAFNSGSKATGLFQFIPSTWKQYGGSANPRDPAANTDAAARLTLANRDQLRASLGREPTEGELYLAHQQGAGGAAQLLSNPDARAVDIVGERAVLGNGGTVSMTAGQFAMLWIRKFDGAAAQVPTPRGSTPFSPEQVRSNPFLSSIWIQAQVADQKEMIATASRLADAISGGIDKGRLPDPQSFAAFLQLAQQFPDQLGRTRDDLVAKARGHDDAQIALGQPTTAGAQLVRDAMAQAQGAPILVQQRAQAMQEAYTRGVTALQNEPWEEAARRGWAAGALLPLDFSSPAALKAGFDARLEVAQSISSRTGAQQSVLSQRDLSSLTNVWATGAPAVREMLAQQLGSLPAEQFGMVMGTNEIREALVGMSRSGDPAKMSVAFSLMDREQRRDPDGFNKLYGRDVENRMATWMLRSQYMSAEQLAREEARFNDPTMQQARKELKNAAMTATEKLTAGDIAGYVGGSWLPFSGPGAPVTPAQAQRLIADYREEYAATFAEIGDEGKARELAVQRIGRVWGVSPTNGGTLMRYPPERAYATINGSHEWLAKQLDIEIRQWASSELSESERRLLGFIPPDEGQRRSRASEYLGLPADRKGAVRQAENIAAATHRLIADARTEAEFRAGTPPTYGVVIQAPNGMFIPLQKPDGRAMRFYGDVEAAMTPLRDQTATRLADKQAGWQGNDVAYDRLTADAVRKRDARRALRQGAQQ